MRNIPIRDFVRSIWKIYTIAVIKRNIPAVIPNASKTSPDAPNWKNVYITGPIISPEIKVNPNKSRADNVGFRLRAFIAKINANSIIIRMIKTNVLVTFISLEKYAPIAATTKDILNIPNTLDKK
jgi:hypothetical protein